MFKKHFKALIISIVLAVGGYVGFSIYIGWYEVLMIFKKISWTGLWIALFLSLVNYVFRFIRWQIYLNHLNHCLSDYWESLLIYFSGFALTTTPAKAGEAIKSIFLKDKGVPISHSLAAMISERVSDLLAIVLLSCLGLMAYPNMRLPVYITLGLIFLGWAIMLYRPLPQLLKQWHWSKRFQSLIDVLEQTQNCHNPKILLSSTVISLLAWGAEAWACYLVLQWCGFPVDLSTAIFIYSASMLIGALSFLPAGLGSAEAGMVSLLIWQNVEPQSALAITIFIRLTTLWFAVILGLIALCQIQIKGANHL